MDRTAKNPNLLCWHRKLYLIDHGAALYFHHNWPTAEQLSGSRFAPVRHHILLPWASKIEEANDALLPLLTESALAEIIHLIPEDWLRLASGIEAPADPRAAYLEFFLRRLRAAPAFVEEAIRARAELV